MISRVWQPTAVLVMALAIVGCGANPPAAEPPRLPLTVTISAAADVNPDLQGRPSAIAVALLQLRTPEKFSKAGYFAVYDPANTTLAEDLIAREQVTMQPGEERVLVLQLGPDARFLGIAAAFRNIEQADWFTVLPVADLAKRRGGGDARIRLSVASVSASVD